MTKFTRDKGTKCALFAWNVAYGFRVSDNSFSLSVVVLPLSAMFIEMDRDAHFRCM